MYLIGFCMIDTCFYHLKVTLSKYRKLTHKAEGQYPAILCSDLDFLHGVVVE